MSAMSRTFIAAVALALATNVAAQTTSDPSGHWEGRITAPFGDIPIALDISNRDGQIVATFTRQDGSISGFPLSDVESTGNDLKAVLKANGGGIFRGSIAKSTLS